MMNRAIATIALAASIAAVDAAAGACPDWTADAALGQADYNGNGVNRPDGLTSAGGLYLNNAAAVAVGPTGRLYASDPGNNRVLSWTNAGNFTLGQPPDQVFGQPDFVSSAPNNGGVSAHSLSLPQGVFVDAVGNLWVADAYNHRVLKFNNPASDATPFDADLVIGQPDFTHNAENLGLGGQGTRVALPDSLLFPGRAIAADGDVYVADSGNSRVLHYTNPTSNRPLADRVFGQYDDFFCRAKNNDGMCENGFTVTAGNMKNPIGIARDAAGRLYVADWANHRILRFDQPLVDSVADAVYGQPGFDTNTFNRDGPLTGLGLPIDLAFDSRGRLFVADSGNNRVLIYTAPRSINSPQCVFGQFGNLSAIGANHGLGPFQTDADGLFGPTGVAVGGSGGLIVADTNNQRIVRFNNVDLRFVLRALPPVFPTTVQPWPP